MGVIEESARLHSEAWGSGKSSDYLIRALNLLKSEYESGNESNIVVNNYAATLLNLHKNSEALALLRLGEPEISEYCSNYAIAIAKSKYDLAEIRKWNQNAGKYPKAENAIVAYIDWHGF